MPRSSTRSCTSCCTRSRAPLDLEFLYRHTSAPYLVGAHGYYLRDPMYAQPIIAASLEARKRTRALEIGPDGDVLAEGELEGETAFAKLIAHMKPYSPEWAQACATCPRHDPAHRARISRRSPGRRIHQIENHKLPYRPVAVSLGKTVTNGWGGYECCWARTLLASLVGALEVPGGILGTTVRLNRPMSERHRSVRAGPDGLMAYPFNPTDARWSAQPNIRNAYRTMVPLAADGPWSQALGPTHFSWMFLDQTPPGCRASRCRALVSVPHQPGDLVLGHRGARSAHGALSVRGRLRLHARRDQPFRRHPAARRFDLESLQLIRIGGSKYIEQFWDHEGFALRQPAIAPRGEARDFTDIATALAARCGLLDYNAAINRGTLGVPLKEFPPGRAHSVDGIWDAVCKAASHELTGGAESHGLDGGRSTGSPRSPSRAPRGISIRRSPERVALRDALPGAARAHREELERRLHEGMRWWDKQLAEYQALPAWKDFPGEWEAALAAMGGDREDYPFWLITARSMQYAWGGNVGMQLIKEVADNVAGHGGVILNTGTARELRSKKATWCASPRRRPKCVRARCCARGSGPIRCCCSASSATGQRRMPETSACPQ